jgi:cell wall-associated NlpC family hydrolase
MSTGLDKRITPARPDIAADHLRGLVDAERFVTGVPMRVVAPVLALSPQPMRDVSIDTQALHGEEMIVYEQDDEGWCWGQLTRDGYVGYVSAEGLRKDQPPPTHKVDVPQTILYPAPNMKMPMQGALPFGAQVHVVEWRGDFAHVPMQGWIFAAHLKSLAEMAADFVAVAERFLHAPYLWGGKTSHGIDCSGLVQVSLQAAGYSAPRDTDLQQAALGAPLDMGDELTGLRRGDLVFWKGHVGIMQDADRLLHANGHHMLVASEPLRTARDRILEKSYGPITAIKRL